MRFVSTLTAIILAPTTAASDRSFTTPEIEPVTSARNTLALPIMIKTIEITKMTRIERFNMEPPSIVAECKTKVPFRQEMKQMETQGRCGRYAPVYVLVRRKALDGRFTLRATQN